MLLTLAYLRGAVLPLTRASDPSLPTRSGPDPKRLTRRGGGSRSMYLYSFLPRGLCHRKMSVRPSVRLSHTGIVSKRLNIIIKLFTPSGSHTSLIFVNQTVWQYSDGDTLTGASNARGYEKIAYFRQISRFISEIIRYKIERWKANRKPYPSFQMVSASMTLSHL